MIRFASIAPDYRRELTQQGVVDGPDAEIPVAFCARANMSVTDALNTP
jgi:hypothetical protein